MKKLAKILITIFTILLMFVIVFGFTSRPIISNTISNLFTKERIVANLINEIRNELPNLTNDKIREIQVILEKSEQIDKISSKYLTASIDYILDKKIEKVNINTEINKMIEEIPASVSEQEKDIIKSKLNNLDLDSVYQYGLKMLENNMNSDLEYLLFVYKIVTNTFFKIFSIMIVLILLILLYYINRNIFKTLFNYSLILYLVAIIGGVTSILLKNNIDGITMLLVNRVSIMDFSILYLITIILLIFGTLLLLLSFILKKLQKFK